MSKENIRNIKPYHSIKKDGGVTILNYLEVTMPEANAWIYSFRNLIVATKHGIFICSSDNTDQIEFKTEGKLTIKYVLNGELKERVISTGKKKPANISKAVYEVRRLVLEIDTLNTQKTDLVS
jgi:hypothetical protein